MATTWPLNSSSWNDWMTDASFAKPESKKLHDVLHWQSFYGLNDPEAARRQHDALEICRRIGVPVFSGSGVQATAEDVSACGTARQVIVRQPFRSPGLRHLKTARNHASDVTLVVLLDHALLVEGGTYDDRTLAQIIDRCEEIGAFSA